MGTSKTRILVAAAASLALTACNSTQPKPGCTIGQGDFAARYTPKAGQTPTGACAALKGEVIGLRDYTDESGKTYIAVRTASLGTPDAAKRVDPNPDNHVYAFGEYPKQSNEELFCVSPTMSEAKLQLAASGTAPAVDKSYAWSNVQILVTPRAAGTQLKADLTYTDKVAGCSATYDVVAMWPAILCGTKNAQGVTVADNTRCATTPDLSNGIKVGCNAAGSCLSPDIKTHCDPELLLCVLDGTPPVFNDQ